MKFKNDNQRKAVMSKYNTSKVNNTKHKIPVTKKQDYNNFEEKRIFVKGWKLGRTAKHEANKYFLIYGDEILKETDKAIYVQVRDRHSYPGKVTHDSDYNYEWIPKSLVKIISIEEWDKLGMPNQLQE